MNKDLFGQDVVDKPDSRSREAHAAEMAAYRAAERDIGSEIIEAQKNIDQVRRHRCQKKPIRFCREYFPDVFYNPFTSGQLEILDAIVQRGGAQTAGGTRTRLKWGKNEVQMPQVAGSAAAGALITIRGLDSAIRGLVRQGARPDLVIVDDPETRESARSLVETTSRIETLTKDILGLAGPGERMAVVYLGTIIRQGCITDQFTDRTTNPAWSGLRHRFLISPPTNGKLWDQYIELRHADQLKGDPYGRGAHKFYIANRSAMDAGAQINNPHRYIAEVVTEKPLKRIRPQAELPQTGEDIPPPRKATRAG